MCASQNTPVYINYQMVKIAIYSNGDLDLVYQIFTKLGHVIPLWKGKKPIYFGVKGQGHRYYK
jgi:hypothetical protein